MSDKYPAHRKLEQNKSNGYFMPTFAMVQELRAEFSQLQAECKRYREALEFYAKLPDTESPYEDWYDDNGKVAKQALIQIPPAKMV